MGTTLKEFISSVIEPLRERPVEEARREFSILAEEFEHIELCAKGKDIGRKVVEGLLALGKSPDYSPLFSLQDEPEKLAGFLEKFGISEIDELEDSVTLARSGCAVELEGITSFSELVDREKAFGGVSLPAVRINFIPQEY